MFVKTENGGMEIPEEIIIAARVIELWAKKNNYKYWCLNGICDRKFAEDHYQNKNNKQK